MRTLRLAHAVAFWTGSSGIAAACEGQSQRDVVRSMMLGRAVDILPSDTERYDIRCGLFGEPPGRRAHARCVIDASVCGSGARCLHSSTLGTVCKCPKKAVVVDWWLVRAERRSSCVCSDSRCYWDDLGKRHGLRVPKLGFYSFADSIFVQDDEHLFHRPGAAASETRIFLSSL